MAHDPAAGLPEGIGRFAETLGIEIRGHDPHALVEACSGDTQTDAAGGTRDDCRSVV
jgi:hypothetical protein